MLTITAPLFELGSNQGPRQLAELGIALVLSTLIGIERGILQKSAGLRTHTLVGVGSALFMEVSQHGFANVLGGDHVVLDPSRVAAQVVSGIGFIGGGLIFVRRDAVRGLTTAATVWVTCAVGMACGGGLPVLAAAVTAVHFVVARGYPVVAGRVSTTLVARQTDVQLTYRTGSAVLSRILELCTGSGFRVLQVRVDRAPWKEEGGQTRGHGAKLDRESDQRSAARIADVLLSLEGSGNVHHLVGDIAELDGVLTADVGRDYDASE